MTFEGFIMLMGVVSGSITILGNVIIQWLNRDKIKADAEKAKAEAMVMVNDSLAQNMVLVNESVTSLVSGISDMTDLLRKQQELTDQRDEKIDQLERRLLDCDAKITTLERMLADREAVIEDMKKDMSELVKSGKVKDTRISALESERRSDRARIIELEKERQELLGRIEKLLQKNNDNGNVSDDNTPMDINNQEIIVDNTTPDTG